MKLCRCCISLLLNEIRAQARSQENIYIHMLRGYSVQESMDRYGWLNYPYALLDDNIMHHVIAGNQLEAGTSRCLNEDSECTSHDTVLGMLPVSGGSG